jgi:hypothetical protein
VLDARELPSRISLETTPAKHDSSSKYWKKLAARSLTSCDRWFKWAAVVAEEEDSEVAEVEGEGLVEAEVVEDMVFQGG